MDLIKLRRQATSVLEYDSISSIIIRKSNNGNDRLWFDWNMINKYWSISVIILVLLQTKMPEAWLKSNVVLLFHILP